MRDMKFFLDDEETPMEMCSGCSETYSVMRGFSRGATDSIIVLQSPNPVRVF